MKTTHTMLLACALALAALSPAQAADDKAQTAQQNKMKDCNAQAGEKKLAGDERKAFMSQCLSAKPASAAASADAATPQQTKMKECNAQAKGKTGDERKAFMSQCLSSKG